MSMFDNEFFSANRSLCRVERFILSLVIDFARLFIFPCLSYIYFTYVFLDKAQGSIISIVGVIITAEVTRAEYKSNVINPDTSKTY